MRHRTDIIQKEIIKAARKLGYSAKSLSQVGGGLSDIILGKHKVNYLIEAKAGKKAKLTPAQQKFFKEWKGQLCRVNSVEEFITLAKNNFSYPIE